MSKLSKPIFSSKLIVLGVWGVILSNSAIAAELGSQICSSMSCDSIILQNGDTVRADGKNIWGQLTGVFAVNNKKNQDDFFIDLANGSKIIAIADKSSDPAVAVGVKVINSPGKLMANNVTILAKGKVATGIEVTDQHIVNLGNGGEVRAETITVPGSDPKEKNRAVGIFIFDSLLQANGIKIIATGDPALGEIVGVYINSKDGYLEGNIDLGRNSIIESAGIGAIIQDYTKLFTADNLTIKANKLGLEVKKTGRVKLNNQTRISTQFNSATGVKNSGGQFTADRVDISTKGSSSHGLSLLSGETKINSTVITTQGTAAHGISNSGGDLVLGSGILSTTGVGAYGIEHAAGKLVADSLTISTKGSQAHGIEVWSDEVQIGSGSTIINKSGRAIKVSGETAVANFIGSLEQRNKIFSESTDAAVYTNNGVIKVVNTDIFSEGGLEVILQGKILGSNLAINNITADSKNYAVSTLLGGQIDLSGNIIINSLNSMGRAIHSFGQNSLIDIIGKSTIIGRVLAENSGIINLNMTSDSSFQGSTDVKQNGQINIEMDNSRWAMANDSTVNTLTANNSLIDFIEDKTGSQLTIKELLGANTIFRMSVKIASSEGDNLIVTDRSEGHHNILIRNDGTAAAKGHERVTLVRTSDGNATFAVIDRSRKIELGGYRYNLRRTTKDQNSWELYSSGDVSSSADTGSNFLNIGYLLNYAETQSLLQRMGELRQNGAAAGNLWFRGFTGKFDSFDSGNLSGFDMSYNGMQLGIDKALDVVEGALYVGMMAGYSKATPNYQSGDGRVKGYHLGIYSSYLTANDVYIDGMIKYAHLKNNFTLLDSQNTAVSGNANSKGYALSVETGKRFHLSKDKMSAGFYFEPQAQLSLSRQGSAATTISNGLNVNLNSYTSALGRMSGVVGYETRSKQNPINVYFKTGYVHEMSGKVKYQLNGSEEQHDFSGGWWDNGFGATAQIQQQHNLYIDATYSIGKRFNQKQANLGYRYNF